MHFIHQCVCVYNGFINRIKTLATFVNLTKTFNTVNLLELITSSLVLKRSIFVDGLFTKINDEQLKLTKMRT